MRPDLTRLAGQALLYGAFVAVIGVFSRYPTYQQLRPDQALIKLSFRHAGALKGDCRRYTAEEIAAMAPNMRRPMDCPRERVPLLLEFDIDGTRILRDWLRPAGLAGDGPSAVYRRFPVPAGEHLLSVRLRDSTRTEGFDYEHEARVSLSAGQNFVVDFDADDGGFRFF